MKNVLKPLSINEIKFGKEYLFAELWYNHGFCTNLNPIVFAKELPTDAIGRHALVEVKGKTSDRYLSGFGILPEKLEPVLTCFETVLRHFCPETWTPVTIVPDPSGTFTARYST